MLPLTAKKTLSARKFRNFAHEIRCRYRFWELLAKISHGECLCVGGLGGFDDGNFQNPPTTKIKTQTRPEKMILRENQVFEGFYRPRSWLRHGGANSY